MSFVSEQWGLSPGRRPAALEAIVAACVSRIGAVPATGAVPQLVLPIGGGKRAMACLRLTALLLLATVSVAACTAVGAGTIALDNYAYSDAMGSAVKRQMLLNMMQLRHGEAPVSAKRMFSLLLVLTSLAETGVSPSAPLITVGTRG